MKRILAASLLLFAYQAHADMRVYGSVGLPGSVEGIELALSLGRNIYELDLAGDATELRANRVGVALYEPVRPWFQPGIQGGFLDVSQSGNSTTAGMDLNGHFVGLLLRSDLFPEAPLGVQMGLSYTYHSADGETDDQRTRLEWYETQARLGAVLRTGPVEWTAGGYYRSVDGEEIANGAVTRTQEFGETEDGGAYAGIDFLPDPGARIGLRVTSGAQEQVSVSFSRRF